MNSALRQALHDARRAEKEQALFYRALAAEAELAEDAQTAEDLNGLHADEQHHLARITVRLLELDERLADLGEVRPPAVVYPGWQESARAREAAEIRRYEQLTELLPDPPTAALIEEILAAERQHAAALGGKFMSA